MIFKPLKKFTLLFLATILMATSVAAQAQFWNKKQNTLLPDQDAFGMTAYIDGDQLKIQWIIAEDYYMYREQFGLSSDTPGVEFGDLIFPKGQIEQDPEFGEVEVYFFNVELSAPIKSLPSTGTELDLVILGQGCNKPVGVCYQPQIRKLKVAFTPIIDAGVNDAQNAA
jgi:thiol:disulfide interchange protein DsbD